MLILKQILILIIIIIIIIIVISSQFTYQLYLFFLVLNHIHRSEKPLRQTQPVLPQSRPCAFVSKILYKNRNNNLTQRPLWNSSKSSVVDVRLVYTTVNGTWTPRRSSPRLLFGFSFLSCYFIFCIFNVRKQSTTLGEKTEPNDKQCQTSVKLLLWM